MRSTCILQGRTRADTLPRIELTFWGPNFGPHFKNLNEVYALQLLWLRPGTAMRLSIKTARWRFRAFVRLAPRIFYSRWLYAHDPLIHFIYDRPDADPRYDFAFLPNHTLPELFSRLDEANRRAATVWDDFFEEAYGPGFVQQAAKVRAQALTKLAGYYDRELLPLLDCVVRLGILEYTFSPAEARKHARRVYVLIRTFTPVRDPAVKARVEAENAAALKILKRRYLIRGYLASTLALLEGSRSTKLIKSGMPYAHRYLVKNDRETAIALALADGRRLLAYLGWPEDFSLT